MEYSFLEKLQSNNKTWRLLRSPNAAFIIHCLNVIFTANNNKPVKDFDLKRLINFEIQKLEDLNRNENEVEADKEASAQALLFNAVHLIDTWISDEFRLLSKRLINHEIHYFILPAAIKAISFTESIVDKPFIGTGDRLSNMIRLLKEITEGTEINPEVRLLEIDKSIAALNKERGNIILGDIKMMDESSVLGKFSLAQDMGIQLLSDMISVEDKFKQLYEVARKNIAQSRLSKGALLTDLLNKNDEVMDSYEFKSFQAFMKSLHSDNQDRLDSYIQHTLSLSSIKEVTKDNRLSSLSQDLLAAGISIAITLNLLAGQFHRYIHSSQSHENNRIKNLIKSIELSFIEIGAEEMRKVRFEKVVQMDSVSPYIRLEHERPLFSVPIKPKISTEPILVGEAERVLPTEILNPCVVNRQKLEANIAKHIKNTGQDSLKNIIFNNPVKKGIKELMVYITIANESNNALIDDSILDEIYYRTFTGKPMKISMPRVIFKENL